MDCVWVKIKWVDEELGDIKTLLHVCEGSRGLSCDDVKGADCRADV